MSDMKQLLVITGLSGAGRSTSAGVLDDLGWFVIDNLPAALVPKVLELASSGGGRYDRVALVMAGYDQEMEAQIQGLRTSIGSVRIVYLNASVDVIVRRYESTKRRHPLSEGSLVDAITREVGMLAPVKAVADLIIDTTDMNPHQLRDRLTSEFGSEDEATGMRITVSSFGFKHGLPLDVDTIIDCRFLPNPFWVENLRDQSGLDEEVREYILEREQTDRFFDRLMGLLDELVPAYADEGRSYFSIAFGCTGGRHRSVVVAETVAESLKQRGWTPRVNHRDIDR